MYAKVIQVYEINISILLYGKIYTGDFYRKNRLNTLMGLKMCQVFVIHKMLFLLIL